MSSLFKSPKVNAPPPSGFNTAGLGTTFNGNSYNLTESPQLQGDLAGVQTAGGTAADTFQNLYGTVAPGFNQMLQSRLADLSGQARAAIGNLSENLAARRILGSSFGQDTITRAQAEFAKQRDATIADNFLQSLDAQRKLTMDQFNTRTAQFQSGLNQLNLESALAAQLTNQATSTLSQNAQLNAKLQASTNQGIGSLIGTGIGLVAAPFTGGASLLASAGGLFGGGGGTPSIGNYGGTPYIMYS